MFIDVLEVGIFFGLNIVIWVDVVSVIFECLVKDVNLNIDLVFSWIKDSI